MLIPTRLEKFLTLALAILLLAFPAAGQNGLSQGQNPVRQNQGASQQGQNPSQQNPTQQNQGSSQQGQYMRQQQNGQGAQQQKLTPEERKERMKQQKFEMQTSILNQQLSDSTMVSLSYRTTTREDFNGSMFQVMGSELQNTACLYLTETFQGLVPGLFTRQSEGGVEDGGVSLWLRGNRSFSGSTLTLVDGQERSIGMLSPEEIISIVFLKDASAVGVYGMRASRGAILVNTKKGYNGKPRVEFSAQLTCQNALSLLEPLDAAGYARQYDIAKRSDGLKPEYTAYDIRKYADHSDPEGHPDVDWLGKYFKPSWWTQRYNFSVQGGSRVNRYYLSIGYQNQPGMFNVSNEQGYNTNNFSDRYNFRSNISSNLSAKTSLNVDLYGWFRKTRSPYTDDMAVYGLLCKVPANSFPEFYSFREGMADQDGNGITPVNGKIVAGDVYRTNPWAYLNRSGYSTNMTMYGSLRAALKHELDFIMPDLFLKGEVAVDSQVATSVDRTRSFAYYYPRNDGSWQKTGNDGAISTSVNDRSGTKLMTINLRLEYDHKFDSRNHLSSAVFYESFETTAGTNIPNRLQGVNGYVDYNYDHRYGITATGSYQGWYGFPKGHKFGFFPTVAAGWTLSNEKWLKKSKAVSFLKVYGSYGNLGSYKGITAFNYMGYLSREGGVVVSGETMENSLTGIYESQIPNPGLTWEKSEQWNLGINARFIRNRLNFTADFFTDRRSDIYTQNSNVSTIIGYNANVDIYENIGEMFTKGFETSLSWLGTLGKLSYKVGGSLSFYTGEVIRDGAVLDDYDYLNAIGYPYGRKLGYVVEGIFQNYEQIAAHPTQSWSKVKPGDYKYKDINGDGIINTSDRIPIGWSNVPELYGGFHLQLAYKNLTFNLLLQGATRVSHSLPDVDIQPFLSYGTMYSHQLDYWTPENPDARYPRTSTSTASANNNLSSTATVVDASYLRVKRAELVYRLPRKLFENIFINGASVYLSGYNLFTWTADKYKDPELASTLSSMPMTRNICIGIRGNF